MRYLAATHPLQVSFLGFVPVVGGILPMITGLTVSTALIHVIWAHPVYVFITGVLVFRVVCARAEAAVVVESRGGGATAATGVPSCEEV